MGGMIAVVVLALLLVPVFFVVVQRVLGRDREKKAVTAPPASVQQPAE